MSFKDNKQINGLILAEETTFNSFDSNCGYVQMDISGNINFMNTRAKEILGYDYKKEGINARMMIHKSDFSHAMKSFLKLYKVGELKNYNARVNTKNGKIKNVQIETKMIYNSQKKPIGAHGIIKEVFF